MAKANAAAKDMSEENSGPLTDTLTYLPGEGDPATVKWGGHVFRANVGKEIKGDPDGTPQEQVNHQIIVSARNNHPHFSVAGQKGPRKQRNPVPTNAEEYRRYFVGWLNDPSIVSAEIMIERFAKDRELQSRCEVGTDDFAFIRDLFMPKLSDLARADEMSNEQVAQLWLNHGYNQLPW